MQMQKEHEQIQMQKEQEQEQKHQTIYSMKISYLLLGLEVLTSITRLNHI
jgi:hypothetical protein